MIAFMPGVVPLENHDGVRSRSGVLRLDRRPLDETKKAPKISAQVRGVSIRGPRCERALESFADAVFSGYYATTLIPHATVRDRIVRRRPSRRIPRNRIGPRATVRVVEVSNPALSASFPRGKRAFSHPRDDCRATIRFASG